MTKEALEQGLRIKRRIEEIDNILNDITPFLHNDIEIDIQKKVLECNGRKLHYRIDSNSPLWLAIGYYLIDIKGDLQQQLDSLDNNSKEQPSDPIEKTKAWWKIWGK